METAKKSKSSASIPVFLVIVAFLLSWFWIVPQYKQNQAEAAQVSHDLTAVKGKLDSLKTAQSTLDGLGSTVDSMLIAIPGGQDTGNIVTTLEAIATANKTYIPSFQISGGTAESTASTETATTTGTQASSNTVSVSFSVNGDFAGLTSFVKAVENNLKFFNVKSVTLASDDKGTMALTLQLEAYTQDNTSSLSAASTTTTTPTATVTP